MSDWDAVKASKKERMRDDDLIRKKLGIGHRDPLPRCPARSSTKVQEFEAAGNFEHSDQSHVCAECGCRRVAGEGTNHKGWGYCRQHEMIVGEKNSQAAADRHYRALVARHPGIYRDLGQYAAMVKQEGKESEERISLHEDLAIARGTVQELLLACEGKEVDAEGRIKCLKEYVQGELCDMSDKTRIQLVSRMLGSVSRLAKSEADLRRETTISLDQFRVWFARLWGKMEEIANLLDSGDVTNGFELQKSFKDAMRAIGEPRSVSAGNK